MKLFEIVAVTGTKFVAVEFLKYLFSKKKLFFIKIVKNFFFSFAGACSFYVFYLLIDYFVFAHNHSQTWDHSLCVKLDVGVDNIFNIIIFIYFLFITNVWSFVLWVKECADEVVKSNGKQSKE